MRPRVDVHAVDRLGDGAGAGRNLADVGGLQPRRLGGRGELAAELAEHEVLAAVLDEAERRGIPERRRSAVADDHLVAVGRAEQLGQVRPDVADQVLHGRLAVRGAEHRGPASHERLELRAAHLRGAAAETSVDGQEVGRDHEVRHPSILRSGVLPAPFV